jgi:ribonuclease HII
MNLIKHETEFWREHRFVIGIDEAGVGALAGPVCAAAVILPVNYWNGKIMDSKKMSPRKRDTVYRDILIDATRVTWSMIDNDIIDRVNVLQATFRACAQAWRDIRPGFTDFLFYDGNRYIVDVPQRFQKLLVRGESKSISIAAASIVAKVTRDRFMTVMHEQWPQYGFRDHKGYWCKQHTEAIGKYGPCPIHRRSFKPIRGGRWI